MRRRLILIGALVALLAIPLVVGATVEKYRYDNTQGWVYWTQVDDVVGGFQTWHFGSASVYQFDSQYDNGVYADVYITEAICPEGVEPWGGYDENGDPIDDPCSYSERWGFSDDASIAILGRKLATAQLSGNFLLYDAETGADAGSGSLTAELTGFGSTWTSMGMFHDRYQGGMGMSKDRWTQREATVTGSFGGTTFTVENSGGGFGVSSGFSLWRSK